MQCFEFCAFDLVLWTRLDMNENNVSWERFAFIKRAMPKFWLPPDELPTMAGLRKACVHGISNISIYVVTKSLGGVMPVNDALIHLAGRLIASVEESFAIIIMGLIEASFSYR